MAASGCPSAPSRLPPPPPRRDTPAPALVAPARLTLPNCCSSKAATSPARLHHGSCSSQPSNAVFSPETSIPRRQDTGAPHSLSAVPPIVLAFSACAGPGPRPGQYKNRMPKNVNEAEFCLRPVCIGAFALAALPRLGYLMAVQPTFEGYYWGPA